AVGLGCDRAEVLGLLPASQRPAVEPALHALGAGGDRSERIVDLVRDASGENAEVGVARRAHELALSGRHAVLERALRRCDLPDHVLEGARELADLVPVRDARSGPEVAL